jgi:hypothetical protein
VKCTGDSQWAPTSIAAIGVDADGGSSGIGELALSSDGHACGYSSHDLVPAFKVEEED